MWSRMFDTLSVNGRQLHASKLHYHARCHRFRLNLPLQLGRDPVQVVSHSLPTSPPARSMPLSTQPTVVCWRWWRRWCDPSRCRAGVTASSAGCWADCKTGGINSLTDIDFARAIHYPRSGRFWGGGYGEADLAWRRAIAAASKWRFSNGCAPSRFRRCCTGICGFPEAAGGEHRGGVRACGVPPVRRAGNCGLCCFSNDDGCSTTRLSTRVIPRSAKASKPLPSSPDTPAPCRSVWLRTSRRRPTGSFSRAWPMLSGHSATPMEAHLRVASAEIAGMFSARRMRWARAFIDRRLHRFR